MVDYKKGCTVVVGVDCRWDYDFGVVELLIALFAEERLVRRQNKRNLLDLNVVGLNCRDSMMMTIPILIYFYL